MLGRRSVRAELARRYHAALGRQPNIEAPKTYNERILHRILYDRDPRLRTICDKLAVRDFIRQHAGPEFVVPLLGVWKDPASIPWDSLPQRFVLKPNHSSGPVAVVRGDAERDPVALAAKAAEWLRQDYFDVTFEWGYRGIPRRVLAEPLLVGPGGEPLAEAQVLTFHGKAALIRVMTGDKLAPSRRANWFDVQSQALPIRGMTPAGDFVLSASDAGIIVPVAERVAAGFSHLRVDFHLADDGPRICELTPYHLAGRAQWKPPEWDEKLGRLWGAGHRRMLDQNGMGV
jgi:hypothetical protein